MFNITSLILYLICIIIIIYLLYIYDKRFELFTNIPIEITKPTTTISPVLKIIDETNLLEKIKKEKIEISKHTNEKEKQLKNLELQLNNISSFLKKQQEEKIKLLRDMKVLNDEKSNIIKITNKLKQTATDNEKKHKEIIKQEANINEKLAELKRLKLKPNPTIPPVIINKAQIGLLMEKLNKIEEMFEVKSTKIVNELKTQKKANICIDENYFPQPNQEAFTSKFNNKTKIWCSCTEHIDNNDCIEYDKCLTHYKYNKHKTTLEKDDLTLYLKCINKFDSYPKFLITNNTN